MTSERLKRFGRLLFYASLLILTAYGAVTALLKHVNKAASAYVDGLMPNVLTNWDDQVLLKEVHPEFLKETSPQKLASYCTTLRSHLGSLIRYGGCNGTLNARFDPRKGIGVWGLYTAQASFVNGTASIRVDVVRQFGRWWVLWIDVYDIKYSKGPNVVRST